MADLERRETESGIDIKPLYSHGGRFARAGAAGIPPFTVGSTATCTADGRGRSASTPDSPRLRSRMRVPLPPRAGPERAFGRVRSADPARARLDDPRAEGEVGRTGVAIDSLADMRRLFEGIPLDQGLDLDDDQRSRRAPSACLRDRRQGSRRRLHGAPRNGPERHSQGVRRPGGTTSSRRGPRCGSPRICSHIARRGSRNWNTISISRISHP